MGKMDTRLLASSHMNFNQMGYNTILAKLNWDEVCCSVYLIYLLVGRPFLVKEVVEKL